MKFIIINGPNLNLLGSREPDIYGYKTLEIINQELHQYASSLNIYLEFFQSNSEGSIIDKIHQSFKDKFNGIIINPAAYTHTSLAIADALKAVNIPSIEVHLSNIYSRESFRQHSFTSQNCVGQICGFGAFGYKLALDALFNLLSNT